MRVTIEGGFTCKCGFHEAFGLYVAAHWDETLERACPDCGRLWVLRSGHMKMKQPTYIAIKENNR